VVDGGLDSIAQGVPLALGRPPQLPLAAHHALAGGGVGLQALDNQDQRPIQRGHGLNGGLAQRLGAASLGDAPLAVVERTAAFLVAHW